MKAIVNSWPVADATVARADTVRVKLSCQLTCVETKNGDSGKRKMKLWAYRWLLASP